MIRSVMSSCIRSVFRSVVGSHDAPLYIVGDGGTVYAWDGKITGVDGTEYTADGFIVGESETVYEVA